MFATLLMLYRNYKKWAGLNTQGRLRQQSRKDSVNRLNENAGNYLINSPGT
jgi:hypothetical protein